MTTLSSNRPLLAVIVATLLVAIAITASRIGGLAHERGVLTAAVRAAAHLAVVSALVAVVLASLPLTAAFLLLMGTVATLTSARRMTPHRSGLWSGVAIGAGAGPVIALLLLSGLVPPRGIALIPMGGIIIGGAMTATTLADRRLIAALHERWGEVEAAMSLGFLGRHAALEVIRPAAAEALVPILDQTRTVGLVTLPGAYVGMLLGGASPAQAGLVQLMVLLSLIAAEMISALVMAELVARRLVQRPSLPGFR